MSIFDIDWNNDGKINFEDTAMDLIILNELDNEDENDDIDFGFDDED